MNLRLQRRQIAELLVGVVPSALLFTPFLLLLLMALAIETVPGLMRGRPPIEDWKGLVLLLMGPIGILALISLTILILAGPERVLKDRMLKILVGGSGIPALMFSTAVVVHQAFGPGRGAEDGQALWIVSLGLSTVVGARYLVHLPELIPPEWVQATLLRLWRFLARASTLAWNLGRHVLARVAALAWSLGWFILSWAIALVWNLGRFLLAQLILLAQGLWQRLLPPRMAEAPYPVEGAAGESAAVEGAAVENPTRVIAERPNARSSQTRPSAQLPVSRSARSRARPSRRKPA